LHLNGLLYQNDPLQGLSVNDTITPDSQTYEFYSEPQSQYIPSGNTNYVNSMPTPLPLNAPPLQSQLKETVDSEGYHLREYPDGRLEWYDSQIGEWNLFKP